MTIQNIKERIDSFLRIRTSFHVYFYSIITGILAGLFAVIFSYALAYFEHFLFSYVIGLELSHPAGEKLFESPITKEYNPFFLFLAPAIGGLLSATVSYLFCPEAKGNGTDEIIKAFHHKGGNVSLKVPFYKSIATIFTIGTGGNAGKEGPTMQIGAGIGSGLANFFKAGDRARRSLMIAGVAGGLGAIFRAPFGGAFTAVEVVYREDIESDTVVPAFLSSVAAYLVATNFTGNSAIFHIPSVQISHYYELFFYVILAFVSLAFGYIFTNFYKYIRDLFERLNIHFVFKPAIGGLVVGIFIVFFHELIGDGLGYMQELILGKKPLEGHPLEIAAFFVLIALLKIVLTSFTVAAGGSGGVFTPSLFIGGMLGAALGTVFSYLFPHLDISIPSFFLVGMAGFFAGVAHAPIAGMIMVCDMVGNYKLLPALMIVSVISAILSKWSIYEGQVENRFHSPAHYWDMNLNILKKILISDIQDKIRKIAVVEPHLLLSDLEDRSVHLQATDYIVVNFDGTYMGICSLRKFHHTKDTEALKYLLTVGDVCDIGVPALKLWDHLSDALRIMHEKEIDKVAIVDDSNQLLGYIRFVDIIEIYHNIAR
ncbi:MAG: chloride channel protein [Leptospiraceae bacterium]|nr:MAG: chloride channel protein [Leptospiraceae bacterium]